MDRLALQSQDALNVFSDEWFRLIQDLHRNAKVRYLIVTAERSSGVVYAPVSNLSRELLAHFRPEYGTGDLIEKIRHEYILPATLEGPIRDLWAAARTDPDVLPQHYLLVRPIRAAEDPKAKRLAVFDGDGKSDPARATRLAARFDEQLQQTSKWLRGTGLPGLLKAASDEARPVLFPHLLLRLEASFAQSKSFRTKRLDLVQMGLALSPDEDLDSTSAETCLNACRISGIAAFAVLYEKERYYERAARQSVTASAVKLGPRKEIHEQVTALGDLDRDDVFNIPRVDKAKSDPMLWMKQPLQGDGTSWYRMPWLDLRSLSDTLLWKVGSQDFELAALMRATVSHLRQVHWRNAQTSTSNSPKEAILGALLLAGQAAQKFYTVASETKVSVEKEFPVLHSSAISFFRKEQLATIDRLMDKVQFQKPLHVCLQWHESKVWEGDVKLPEHNLRALCTMVDTSVPTEEYRVLHADSVHADAHFGNLLVDASVPEDPLIVSIDPKPLKPASATEFGRETASLKINAMALDMSLHSLLFDPLYDLSKCVMSTSGLHGPIIRGALELSSTKKSFTLANPPDGIRHLTDTGGMSSAKLIRVGTQVPQSCLRDHDICARALLREVREALSADAGKPGTDKQTRLGVNIGLIRLWGLSLRALFSAAADRFPGDMPTGVALFILGSAYLDIGTKIVVKVLTDHSLSDEQATPLLEMPFRWYSPS